MQHKLSAETVVKNRADERWRMLIEGRLESAYLFQTPEYRHLYDFKHYRKQFGGARFWSKAEVTNVTCDVKCIVDIKVYVTIRAGRWGDVIETSQVVKEQWVRSADLNEWFYLSSN